MNENSAIAYVDGSFANGIAGYGIVFIYEKKDAEFFYGQCRDSSMRNVSGEIDAARKAVEKALEYGCHSIKIYHDYIGVAAWVSGEWKAKNEKTVEYRDIMRDYMEFIQIEFQHVKGHSGNIWNEKADRLAKQGVGLATEKKEILPMKTVEGLNPECVATIQTLLSKSDPKFQDYVAVKTGGQDCFSRLKGDALEEATWRLIKEEIMEALNQEDHLPKVFRWMLRGLPMKEAIHKVNVDEEVARNCRK